MGLVVSSIFLFLLLTPGFAYMAMYVTSPFSIKVSKRKFLPFVTYSAIPAIILHGIGVEFIDEVLPYNVDLTILGNLLISDSNSVDSAYPALQDSLLKIILYHFCLILFGGLLGFLSRHIVRMVKWDRKHRIFRFSNKWHYIFTGERLDFKDIQDSYDDISIRILNILCKTGTGQLILYSGHYSDYYLDNGGRLESVLIKSPVRRYLLEDEQRELGRVQADSTRVEEPTVSYTGEGIEFSESSDDRYYEIPSRYLMIKADTILNINMFYFNFEEKTDDLQTRNSGKSKEKIRDMASKFFIGIGERLGKK